MVYNAPTFARVRLCSKNRQITQSTPKDAPCAKIDPQIRGFFLLSDKAKKNAKKMTIRA